ncbi:TerD family protein [Pseudobacteroides cellulosolvens]|uniref:Stress protein n=1 Tax=Pseudobacteroides cellulosolvens ATCC 35603 = DSM 2933 TaxID=398512 RepID=A0A0L6JV26_9FIRM|nr:TerD family protein [Pseudobacteroides cellulosolvens]KNY29267.1 stress protein [Pseudobacteroides cellulosolvens ATCC 35603 = DSM 2933]
MDQLLQPGGNIVINSFSGTVAVTHDIDNNFDINLTAFLLNDADKVNGDTGIVFYNQPEDPDGVCSLLTEDLGNTRNHKITFHLDKFPSGISKISITLTEDNNRGFSKVKNLRAVVNAGNNIISLSPGIFSNENGIVVLELYIINGQPKVKSVWKGFSSGLNGLCKNFGVEVQEDSTIPSPNEIEEKHTEISAPQPVLISLKKKEDVHKISLIKNDNAPDKILVSATWIDNGDRNDNNDDLDLRVGILLPDGRMKIIQAPDKAGDFNKDPYVFHTGDITKASQSCPGKETVHVNPKISTLMGGRVVLVCSVYSAVSNGAVSIASLKPKMRMEYGSHVVECSYEFEKKFGGSFIYTYVIGLIEIDQDNITLKPSGQTSKFMSEATPWLEWHNGTYKLTMDGPPVFKGVPSPTGGKKSYS